MSLDRSEPVPPRLPEPDPDATLIMPAPGPEALGDAARSADPADEAVEPTASFPRRRAPPRPRRR